MRLLFLALILVPFYCSAQSVSKLMKKGSVEQKVFQTQLDADIIYKKYVIKNVQVNGSKKRYNFILDSGAPCSITPSLANELNLSTKASSRLTDGHTEKEISFGTVNFSLNGIKFNNIAVGVMDVFSNDICNIDGIIGNNLLTKCCWKITRNSICISNKVESFGELQDYNQINVTMQGLGKCYPYIVANFGTPRATALLDFGDDATISIGSKIMPYVNTLNQIEGEGMLEKLAFSNGGAKKTTKFKACKIEGFKIDTISLSASLAYIERNSFSCSIGLGILSYADFILDLKNSSLLIKKNNLGLTNEFKSYGFGYDIKENKATINFLWKDTEAYHTLKNGDEIVKINNTDIQDILDSHSMCEAKQIIHKILRDVETIKLETNRNTVILTKEFLFHN